jgi:hypothetical protein
MTAFAGEPTLRAAHADRASRRSLGRAVAVALAALIALLGLCQLLLPSIATSRLRSALSANGSGVHVSLHAFPAAELLFGHADSVDVRIDRLRISKGGSGSLHQLLQRIGRTGQLNASVGSMWSHNLELRHVLLRKRGGELTLRASVTHAAIARALPSYLRVTGTAKAGGGLSLSLTASVLGKSVTAHAAVVVHAGDVEIVPGLALLEGLGLKLFSDPDVAADSVSMTAEAGRYTIEAAGHYR